MPETEVTREQLLASVHTLEPGDVLVIRLPADTRRRDAEDLADAVRSVVEPLGARVLVMAGTTTVEVVRRVDTIDEAVRLATANPGRTFEADPGATS
jgi:hypothetical protein